MDNIPSEILTYIFSFTGKLNVILVCKYFYEIYMSNDNLFLVTLKDVMHLIDLEKIPCECLKKLIDKNYIEYLLPSGSNELDHTYNRPCPGSRESVLLTDHMDMDWLGSPIYKLMKSIVRPEEMKFNLNQFDVNLKGLNLNTSQHRILILAKILIKYNLFEQMITICPVLLNKYTSITTLRGSTRNFIKYVFHQSVYYNHLELLQVNILNDHIIRQILEQNYSIFLLLIYHEQFDIILNFLNTLDRNILLHKDCFSAGNPYIFFPRHTPFNKITFIIHTSVFLQKYELVDMIFNNFTLPDDHSKTNIFFKNLIRDSYHLPELKNILMKHNVLFENQCILF